MKREEILAMKPGRDLDALVFKFVIGGHIPKPPFRANFMKYSSDICAAWVVVDKIKSMLFSKRNKFLKELQALTNEDSEYCIAWPDVFWTITPEVICKAALLAVLEEEETNE